MSTGKGKILVTGATGLVGSRLLLDLVQKGREVRALRRTTSDTRILMRTFRGQEGLLSHIEWFDGDITEVLSVRDALEGVEEVYHAAGLVSFDPRDRSRLNEINTMGTTHVVNMSLEQGVSRLCHISSVAALGRSEPGVPVDEKTAWKISKYNSAYAVSKFNAEREVWRGMEEGLPAVILNPSIILGPGNPDTGSSLLFRAVWEGLRFYPVGSTGYVDVRDVSRIAVALMEQGRTGERFVINAENVFYRDLFRMIASAFGKRPPSVRVSATLKELAWRLETVRSALTGKAPRLTRETAATSSKEWRYDASMSVEATGISYIPVVESVRYWSSVLEPELHQRGASL
jgi:nucleoside-diphosphate-sugar epimerase